MSVSALSLTQGRLTLQTADGWPLALHFFLPSDVRFPHPWLMVHGFSQSHLTWTAGGFAQQVAAMGCPVYVLDLRGHGESKPPSKERALAGWGLDDYFLRDIPAAIEAIEARHPGEQRILCGHSMGGAMAIATALRLHQEQVAAVVSIAAPLDPAKMGRRIRLSALAALRAKPLLERSRLRKLPMQHFFSMMERLYYARGPKIGRLLPYTTPYDRIQAVPRLWHPAHIDEDTLRSILSDSFAEPMQVVWDLGRWIKDRALWFGHPAAVDYAKLFYRLTVPVIAAWGEDDFLAPPACGKQFQERIRSQSQRFLSLPLAHHVDITAGRPARQILTQIEQLLQKELSAPVMLRTTSC